MRENFVIPSKSRNYSTDWSQTYTFQTKVQCVDILLELFLLFAVVLQQCACPGTWRLSTPFSRVYDVNKVLIKLNRYLLAEQSRFVPTLLVIFGRKIISPLLPGKHRIAFSHGSSCKIKLYFYTSCRNAILTHDASFMCTSF